MIGDEYHRPVDYIESKLIEDAEREADEQDELDRLRELAPWEDDAAIYLRDNLHRLIRGERS